MGLISERDNFQNRTRKLLSVTVRELLIKRVSFTRPGVKWIRTHDLEIRSILTTALLERPSDETHHNVDRVVRWELSILI